MAKDSRCGWPAERVADDTYLGLRTDPFQLPTSDTPRYSLHHRWYLSRVGGVVISIIITSTGRDYCSYGQYWQNCSWLVVL